MTLYDNTMAFTSTHIASTLNISMQVTLTFFSRLAYHVFEIELSELFKNRK